MPQFEPSPPVVYVSILQREPPSIASVSDRLDQSRLVDMCIFEWSLEMLITCSLFLLSANPRTYPRLRSFPERKHSWPGFVGYEHIVIGRHG
jgi:hypothetical protein